MGGRSGGSQTVTQKQEIDPVLRAHLYGGTIPGEYMSGIVPAYFQPGGTLAGQAESVNRLYGPQFWQASETEAQSTPSSFGGGGAERDGGGQRHGGFRDNMGDRLAQEAAGRQARSQREGSLERANPEPGMGGLYNEGGIVSLYQEGGAVFPDGSEDMDYRPYSLAQQVYDLTVGTDLGAMLPEYQVAARTPMQQRAEQLAQQGVGVYQPYLDEGAGAIRQGIQATGRAIGGTERLISQIPGEVRPGQEALRRAARETYGFIEEAAPFREEGLAAIRQGREMLGGAAQLYDPTAYRGYMDPYTEEVIRQTERDIARMGDIERQRIGAGAVQAGAFGGSRQAVAEQELARNLAEQQARTAAQLRSQGYQTAQQQAQQAFEQQQQRQLTTGQSFGQLGTQTGALGTSFGQLGLQGAGQAGQLGAEASRLGLQGIQTGFQGQGLVGQLSQGLGTLGTQMIGAGSEAQRMGLQDVNALSTMGAQQQAQRQAELDAQRMTEFQRVMAPFQQTAFRADVLSGSPTGIVSTFTQPGPSPVSQLAGLGIGAYGLSRSGLFG